MTEYPRERESLDEFIVRVLREGDRLADEPLDSLPLITDVVRDCIAAYVACTESFVAPFRGNAP